jgi:hypothetical protein
VGQLQSVLESLSLEPVEGFSPSELADSLVELEEAASRLEAERCRRLSALIGRRAHRDLEYSSPSALLIDRARVAPSRAARLVAQANALFQSPVVASAWAEGVLGQDQVRQLLSAREQAPETFAAHEETLTETVSMLGVVDSGRVIQYWRFLADTEHTAEAQLYERRRLHLSQTFGGMWRLDGWLDPLAGEIVRTTLDAATPPPSADDVRSPAQRRADALTDLCQDILDSGVLPEQGGEKPHLLVLVGADRLHGLPHGLSETVSGTVLSQSAIDLLACDCAVSRIVYAGASEVIDVGRKSRVIPPHLRRAVIARDRHCQHPGCRRPAKWCDVDHILPWSQGGETTLGNLQLLCRYHHRLKHLNAKKERRLQMERNHVGPGYRTTVTLRC